MNRHAMDNQCSKLYREHRVEIWNDRLTQLSGENPSSTVHHILSNCSTNCRKEDTHGEMTAP